MESNGDFALTLEADGDIPLAGTDGLTLDIANNTLSLTGNAYAPRIDALALDGRIGVDGVGAFGLKQAEITFPQDGGLPSLRLMGVSFRAGDTFGVDIGFPTGAGFVYENGESFLEYGVIDIDFTPESPIQVIGDLNFSDGGGNRRLALDGITFEELIAALELDPGEGIGVKIYDYVTAIWYGGTLTEAGIANAEFSLASDELPLPDSRVTIPMLSFKRGEPVRFAFFGDFELDDNTPAPAKVRVPPNRPVWLEVGPNSLRLSGRVEVFLDGGTSFAGELLLDDPNYAIKVEAGSLTLPLADGLADLLPANAASCLPVSNDGASLDLAAACLLPSVAANTRSM